MLRLIGPEDLPFLQQLCSRDPIFGTTVLTLWESHRENWRDFTAWTGLDGRRRPRYALCRYGHRYTLCAPDGLTPFCVQELAAFLKMEPEVWLEGDEALLCALQKQLPLELSSYPILKHQGPSPAEGPWFGAVSACADYSAVFSLISQAEPMGKNTWLSRMFPLFRDGACRPFALWEGERLASCAILEAAPQSPSCVISSLVTAPELRGQGRGKAVISELCRQAALMGRDACLVCGEESLTAFYIPLGFQPIAQRYGILRGNPEQLEFQS